MQLAAGDKVDDKYLIRSVLGTGGFGTVYEASQEALGRSVALKLLTDCTDPEITARLMREAQALSTIHHRNVIQCFGYGLFNGVPYIAVEFVPGHSLQDELNPGKPLPCHRVLDIIIQICAGLAAAHAQGIVHRDLKPANILLCKTSSGADQVKIIDFGLAKLLPEAGINAKFQQLTDMGLAIGSVRYMSPEQCLGQPATPRSDIYALGCILYECLTGNRCFDADAAVAVMFRHLNEPIPRLQPVKQNAANQKLQETLNRALCKDENLRYGNMIDFQRDLEDIARDPHCYVHDGSAVPAEAPDTVPAARARPALRLMVAAVCACLGAMLVAMLYASQFHAKREGDPLRAAERALETGDYKVARGELRIALANLPLTDDTTRLAEFDVCLTYCAEGKTEEFFRACENLRSKWGAAVCRLALAQHQRYRKTNRSLALGSLAIFFECSPVDPHAQVTLLCTFLEGVIQSEVLRMTTITDVIAVENMQKLSQQIEKYPAEFASVCALRAQLQGTGGSYSACAATTGDIMTKLERVKLAPEDAQVLQFLGAIHSFDPRQVGMVQSLSGAGGTRWIQAIAWFCDYEALCGHSQQAKATSELMAKWCAKYGLDRGALFGAIAVRGPRYNLRRNQDGPIRVEALSELPGEPLLQNVLIVSSFAQSDALAREGRRTEALALFSAGVRACKQNKIDLPWIGADTPGLASLGSTTIVERCLAACDEYYKLMPLLGRSDVIERAHVACERNDIACRLVMSFFNPTNLDRALKCSDDDLKDAADSGNPEWLADARIRRARLYATAGNAEKFVEYWNLAYAYDSQHRKKQVASYLHMLAAHAWPRNRALAYLLQDDSECTIDGVVTYPTARDFDALPSSQNYHDELVSHIRPALDHALRMGHIDIFESLRSAASRAAWRTGDETLLMPMLDVVNVTLMARQEKSCKDLLNDLQKFAETHKVSLLFEHSLKLQQGDYLFFFGNFTPEKRHSESFRQAEELYKQDVQLASRLLHGPEAKPDMGQLYADAVFRLARLYIVTADTENFTPLWGKCILFYAKFSDPQVFEERVNEMTRMTRDFGHMPELAAKIERDGRALRQRVKH